MLRFAFRQASPVTFAPWVHLLPFTRIALPGYSGFSGIMRTYDGE